MAIERLLIANRGEIAVRIARSCRDLGITSIAVHSDADADALHVRRADLAERLGPAPAAASYLDVEQVLAAARRSGADAVHPGYGFLSENAGFARAVAEAGLVWVGPTPDAIELMGDKAAAKRAMAAAGVLVVAGVQDDTLDDDALTAAATEVGVPLLVKAVAGGGGKGMRPVHDLADLPDAIAAARREAKGAFGDDRLIVEQLIQRPRHIEMQVVGDTHGNVVHLFERECSIQRRHQKIVEETPAPNLSDDLRQEIADAAVAAAQAVDYVGAGTVEFILGDDGRFAFLEMNTRLQVEHPVTELVTGVDLVAWQLAIADGKRIPVTQDQLTTSGSAIEVRLYAEDPANEFLPDVGTVLATTLDDDHDDDHVRIDTGVRTGSVVSRHYDPMLAKLIVHDHDRDAAVGRLRSLLRDTVVLGVRTNLDHLQAVVAEPAFAAGELTTDFLDDHLPEWRPADVDRDLLAAVAAAVVDANRAAADDVFTGLGPWRGDGSGWTLHVRDRDTDHSIEVASDGAGLRVAGGVPPRSRLTTVRHGDDVWVHRGGDDATTRRLTVVPPTRHADPAELVGGDAFVSPMPGAVVAVNVADGDAVTAGQALVVVEAMKMEHPVTAPTDGIVTEVFVRAGDAVDAGQPLLSFETEVDE